MKKEHQNLHKVENDNTANNKEEKKEQLKSSVNLCQCHLFQKYQQLLA